MPGAVSGLLGDLAAPPPVIRDAQAHDAELPDRATDAPPTWIDPQLLTDELDTPASLPPAPSPLAPPPLEPPDDPERRRRRARPADDARPPAAEAPVAQEPAPRRRRVPLEEIPEPAPEPVAPTAEETARPRRVPLEEVLGPEHEEPLPAGEPATAHAPAEDDIFSSPEDVFGPAAGSDLEPEELEPEPVEAEAVADLPRAVGPAPQDEDEDHEELDEPAQRLLSDYLAALDDDEEDEDDEEFGLPPSLSPDTGGAAEDDAPAAEPRRRAASETPGRSRFDEDAQDADANEAAEVPSGGRVAAAVGRRIGRRRSPRPGEASEEDYGISWDDDPEVPEAAGEAPAEPAAWTPSLAVSASRGVFAYHSALSLISPNLTQDNDELNDALAAFGSLEQGMRGFIRVTFRAYPEFKSDSVRFINAIKTGTDPNPKRGPGQMVFGLVSWGLQTLFHLGSGAGQRGMPMPRPPWKGPEMREISPRDMTDDMRQSIRDAENKSRNVAFYETVLSVGVAGSPKQMAELERVRAGIESGFEVYATPYQRLVFEEWPGYDAAIGYMPPVQENRLVLSADELGEIARVPDALTRPQGVVVHRARVKPLPPTNPLIVRDPLEPEDGVIPLGIIGRGTDDEKVIGMRNAELDQHAFITGRTGTGKSVLMHWLIHGSVKADYPVVVVDPHGSLSEDCLHNIVRFAPERADDVVLVDFGEPLWPVALNPLDITDREQVEPTVASVKEMLARQMSLGGDSAPRAVAYVTQALSVLAEANLYLPDPATKCTLLQVPRFFQDTEFRQLLMNFCSNPSVREAFDPETGLFERLSEKQQLEISAPIQRAFQPLMNSRSFANSFAAGENRLDFRKLVADKKVVILKIPRFGGQTELGSFVGALAIPYLLQSMDSWGRRRDPKSGEMVGRGVRLFIDEAPTVCGPNSSVVTVLAEARKWDLGVVAAAQFPRQLDRAVEEAFYANTASKISLALDPGGVGGMARSLAGDGKLISADDIVALPNYAAYASVLLSDPSGGKFTSGAFSMGTLPPLPDWHAARREERPRHRLTGKEDTLMERIVARSRELVCNPREEIEDKRNRILEDIRTALTQVLQDRAGELPGSRAREDMEGGFTAMDLDDEGPVAGGFDWSELD